MISLLLAAGEAGLFRASPEIKATYLVATLNLQYIFLANYFFLIYESFVLM